MAKMNDDESQQLQILDYQIKQLEKIMQSVDNQLLEIQHTIDALKEFSKIDKDAVILCPVANGIFAKAKLADTKTLNLNIGSDVNVEKSVDDTITMMLNQAKDIESYREELDTQLQKFKENLSSLQGE